MFSPDGGEGAETTGSFDVADEADCDKLESLAMVYVGVGWSYTGGVSMTVTASTTSFLCILAPGRSMSRTMVVMPAL